MREVGILEAKTRLSSLVSEVERGGGEITVTRNGRPVVKIVPLDGARPQRLRTSGEELDRYFAELRARTAAKTPKAAVYDEEGVLRSLRDGDDYQGEGT